MTEPEYRVVSYGGYQTGESDGLREHGQFDDAQEAVSTAQLLVEYSLRQDAPACRSADELARRYWDFGIVPVIWGDPKPEFDPHEHAKAAAPTVWAEYLGRLAERDAKSREVQWEQARARHDKVVLVRALAFAAGRHRDQRRGDAAQSPYINHSIGLTRILAEEGGVTDTVILCAALLRDTLENTDTARTELEAEFGALVAALVGEVSDDASQSKAERKRLQIERAATLSRRGKLLRLADKIADLRELAQSTLTGAARKQRLEHFDWAKAVIDALRGVHPRLEAIFDEAYRRRPVD